MAVTKELIKAIPYESGGNVNTWELEMLYKQGTPDTADYYELDFRTEVSATEPAGEGTVTNFTPKPKGNFTLVELTALCPTSKWDISFDLQYDNIITNPITVDISDESFSVPT